jgi:hypothetical protein
MIRLTEEQRQTLVAAGERPPTVMDPETRETYVLIRSDVYERLRRLFQDDDMTISKRELAILVERAMKEYDANDPTLELYQHDQD